ncbi:hypothetical protein JNUCC31_27995 [Paenibacillus sp. JNUCC31]|uniref:hypothetical protein n=1 Tax=Paenibacillus sp. JNUCC-31 TaxID=2777983 RepID=UPI0017831799|nr:hypothetical protein [Paenibacillus sp. JNUCC-31]QOS78507.1 hypothetical protein JNUCC31_27995 [Paenibacillus sp. JNUCC-31]
MPDSSIIELQETPSNISAGIAFRLHSRKDITIQYDLEKIYITRTDLSISMNPPKHIVSAAAIVMNENNELVKARD